MVRQHLQLNTKSLWSLSVKQLSWKPEGSGKYSYFLKQNQDLFKSGFYLNYIYTWFCYTIFTFIYYLVSLFIYLNVLFLVVCMFCYALFLLIFHLFYSFLTCLWCLLIARWRDGSCVLCFCLWWGWMESWWVIVWSTNPPDIPLIKTLNQPSCYQLIFFGLFYFLSRFLVSPGLGGVWYWHLLSQVLSFYNC